jgi:hypothetical protein
MDFTKARKGWFILNLLCASLVLLVHLVVNNHFKFFLMLMIVIEHDPFIVTCHFHHITIYCCRFDSFKISTFKDDFPGQVTIPVKGNLKLNPLEPSRHTGVNTAYKAGQSNLSCE